MLKLTCDEPFSNFAFKFKLRRYTKGSMQRSTDYLRNRRRSLRPYLRSLPPQVHPVLLQAVFPKRADGTVGQPVGLAAQGDARFHGFKAGAYTHPFGST